MFARSDELLGEEIAEPSSRFDSPVSLLELLGRVTQPVGLGRARSDLDLVDHVLVYVDGNSGAR